MEKEELQQKIALYYSKLPPNAQALFSSMNWLETLKTISQKYGLNEEQIETLGTETTLVLLGIIHPVEYEEALSNELKLQRDTTEKILIEIEQSIIKTVRPQLILAFNNNQNSETEEIKIDQKLDKRFEKLPQDIENIVEKSNYQTTLYAVAKEHNLTVIQMEALEKAVANLITGTIPPDEFENYLQKNLDLPREVVGEIVNEINEKIFKKIREELVKNTERQKIIAKDEEDAADDIKILNAAGIEIVPSHNPLETPKVGVENGSKLPALEKLELTTPKRPENSPLPEYSELKSEEEGDTSTPSPKRAPPSRGE